jgi:TolB protein
VITAGHVYVMNADGSGLREVTSRGSGYDQLLGRSPDGTTLEFDRVTNGVGAIHTVGTGSGNLHELTPSPTDDDYWGVWSPSGKRIAFDRASASAFGDIRVKNASGSGQTQLTADPHDNFGSAWSPDSSTIAFMSNRSGSYRVYVMPAAGGLPLQLSHAVKGNAGAPQPTTVPYDNTDPAWSPDGKEIAFLTTRDGGSDVYVMNADGSGQRRLG